MRLLLSHPEVGARSCADCRRWIHDEQGRRRWRVDRWVEWPAGTGPDCHACPKCANAAQPGPESGMQNTLSARNWQTLRAFWEHQACPGGARLDAFARKNFGILKNMLAQHDRDCLSATTALLQAALTMTRR